MLSFQISMNGRTMAAQRHQSEADIYHVMARGTGGQLIFEDDYDYNEFLALMAKATAECVDIYAWCLMNNHFHLLLHGPLPCVSEFMKQLLGRYARYFNMRHERRGHLFQEKFRSEPVNDNEYLFTVVKYIHTNPDRAHVGTFDTYRWSSYHEYFGRSRYCSTEFVRSLFDGPEDFFAFHAALDDEPARLGVDNRLGGRRLPSDEELIRMATDLLGGQKLADVKTLERTKRDGMLRRLKAGGLSIRQIERLTGISKSVVARA